MDMLYGVPILGHGLAGLNALAGRGDEARKAYEAANRTTAVVVGGIGGAMVGGPAGMVGGAIAAGTMVDTMRSIGNDRPEGVISGLAGICDDLGNGRIPIRSTLVTALHMGGDALSGVTNVNLASNLSTGIGRSLTTQVAKETSQKIIKEGVKDVITRTTTSTFIGNTTRKLADRVDQSKSNRPKCSNSGNGNTSNNKKSSSKSTSGSKSETSSGGQEPPRNNKNKSKSEHERDQNMTESHFEVFYELFDGDITSLDDIQINGVYLFREITSGLPTDRGRKNTLKKLISCLREHKIIRRVIKTVREILNRFKRSEVNFQNFLNLCEMVATHVSEQMARRRELQSGYTPGSFHTLREMKSFLLLDETSIYDIFKSLRKEISTLYLQNHSLPTFANITTAVTHYYKHRFVPASDRILSPRKYFRTIRRLLSRVMTSSEYSELESGTRRRLVYDVFLQEFGRRVRLVLQVQNGKIVVSSCHILDVIIRFDDEDGDEEFDPSY